jgi:amino acid adenylation domain-containing protein
MRRSGLHLDVRGVFLTPTLSALAAAVAVERAELVVPPNLIVEPTDSITPDMLPLVQLEQAHVDAIVAQTLGGARNVQDIYPLAPLQEGILFHHLMGQHGDPYLLPNLLAFSSQERLERFLAALQSVVTRHDILRTAVLWEGLPEPVQVVARSVQIQVERFTPKAELGDVAEQLKQAYHPRHYRIELTQAPLLRAFTSEDSAKQRWLLLLVVHHLVIDHTTLDLLVEETRLIEAGRHAELSAPQPFRNFVAETRLGVSREEHVAFFSKLLGDITEPTAPFGLLDIQGDGSQVAEAQLLLDADVSRRVRDSARALGVSAAGIMHLAWAVLLARVSGRQDVVFGSVLSGRMQVRANSERTLGMFINTLPVRISVREQGVLESLHASQRLLAELIRHEHAALSLAQRCSAVPAQTPLFSALLNFRHSAQSDASAESEIDDGVEALWLEERTNYPLALSIDDLGRDFVFSAQVSGGVSAERVCQLMRTTLVNLLQALASAPNQAIAQVEVLPAAEREQVLVEWNATGANYARELCAHELFEAHAAHSPEHTALFFGDERVSYSELNQRANRLAHHLRSLGAKPDARVAICAERGIEFVVAALATLKAGAAYVPLDPSYPFERLDYMLSDSAPFAVLVDLVGRAALAAVGERPLLLLDAPVWDHASSENPAREAVGLLPTHLAYVIYTSGSTGQPKGVMNEHRGISNLVHAQQQLFAVGPQSRVLQFASTSFDASVWELFMALGNGAGLVLAPRAEIMPGRPLLTTLERNSVTHVTLPPSALAACDDDELAFSASTLIVAGEAISAREADKWSRRVAFFNAYGPTETTVCASVQRCSPGSIGSVPIGRPIANAQVYVLDAERVPLPVGVAGEIYIGGAGVARGYLNKPELSAERFLADPFASTDTRRLYKTGDLGRWLADGTLEFLGRNDYQVKVRGFRIELGEIEARLGSLAGVREVVVLAREDQPGDKRLVAYYADESAPDVETLREHARASLPDYMVPAAFVRLAALPLTANGKLDRKALPAPDVAWLAERFVAPENELENALAEIWSELFGLERVGRNDHFFELGGHSLLAVKLASRVRQKLGLEFRLGLVFTHPRLHELAREIEAARRSQEPTIGRLASSGPQPLSFAQQRLWFLSRFEGVSAAYHIPLNLRLEGQLDVAALAGAIDHVVERHDALRTRFVELDGSVVQVVDPPRASSLLEHHDLTSELDPAAALERLQTAEAGEAFDLRNGPLFRARLVKLAERDHVLLTTVHHIVSDGWSMGLMLEEICAAYAAFQSDAESPLAPLAIQYTDFAVWQREYLAGERLQRQAKYWQETLVGAPALLELPTDKPRPAEQSLIGDTVALELDTELSADLRALARRHGSTLYMTLLGAWASLLARLAAQEQVVIGSPVAGRLRAEVEPLIGLFVNTLALRFDFSANPSVTELMRQTKKQVLAAQEHQDLPFEQVVELVQPPRSLAHTPLFQAVFSWEQGAPPEARLPGLEMTRLDTPEAAAKFDVTLELGESEGRIRGGLNYATALFERGSIERMLRYFETLLRAMVVDDARCVSRLPYLTERERERIVVGWNETRENYAHAGCWHELFESVVERTPDAAAVAFGARTLSYSELNARANRLAHHLRTLGVVPDSRVAICLDRGIDSVVAILATLKAGGAYVPLDPTYPTQRLDYMLSDAGPVLALVDAAGRAALDFALSVPLVDLARDTAHWAALPSTNPSARSLGLGPQSLAYVIYTSGSTGKPKGVMNEHGGLCNLAQSSCFNLGPESRMLQFASASFDASVWELVMALSNGASLQLTPREEIMPGRTLLRTLSRLDITHLLLPPTALALCDDPELPFTAKTLIVGGDAISAKDASRWAARVDLLNAYGPTEAAVVTTVHRCSAEATRVPIGRPLPNARVYILDAHGDPVGVGVAGEIYIGGAGVARGYLNRPELSAERFVVDRLSGAPNARLYRTGDLGRFLADGSIEFVGRNDFQVKVRGFRIELGEIEARLREVAQLRDAVVVAREDEPGDKRLVAYYTAEGALTAEELRAQLSVGLPEYMVPSAFVLLEQLPLSGAGKVDRKALPRPEGDAFVSRAYEAPQGSVEESLAKIWQDLLRLERVGRSDHFFELGGHSLLAVQVVSRVQSVLGLEPGLGELFTQPVLKDFAARLGALQGGAVQRIERVSRAEPLELSFAQQRLWFLSQMAGVSEAYHIPCNWRLEGELDRDALKRALCRVVERHEALRTRFVTVSGVLQQRIADSGPGFSWVEEDLSESWDSEDELSALVAKNERERFDLEQGPLLRVSLVKLAAGDHVLLLTLHHIVADGWSLGVLMQELSALYSAFRQGLPDPLPEVALQYVDYAAWQRAWLSGSELERQTAYWRKALTGAPSLLELPTDRARPNGQNYAGSSVSVELDHELSQGLKALARRHGATLYATLLSGFSTLLGRLSGQADVVVGSPVAGRRRTELEPMIGLFVNTLALRLDVEGTLSVSDLLRETQARVLAAQEHQDLPFEQVVEVLQPVRSLSHAPIFQVLFSWQNTPEGKLALGDLKLSPLGSEQPSAKFDLSLDLEEYAGGIRGELCYATALFERETIERWVRYFKNALSAMARDERQALSALELMGEDERRRVLVEWNATAAEYPREYCVHELFEAQVTRTPEAIAVEFQGQQLTYAELNAQANQLAHYLQKRGVAADTLVGVCLERTTRLAVALLGILKAGGAYLPLDPAYPPQRLAFIRQDSGVKLVLAERASRHVLEPGSQTMLLDEDWSRVGLESREDLAPTCGPDHLVYVIYTSGSTGEPKGAEITHAGLVNYVWWTLGAYEMAAGSGAPVHSSLSFDLTVTGLWGPWLCGKRVLLLPDAPGVEELKAALSSRSDFSLVKLTPAHLDLLNQVLPEGAASAGVRRLVVGGEALRGETVSAWQRACPDSEQVVNEYGPTETVVGCCVYFAQPGEVFAGTVPIGRPIANTELYVLDERQRPVALGVPGELYIGGAGLARGYLNRPELTAQKFVPHPFATDAKARLYRTGDVVRYRGDGNLEFLGRKDEQVKVRGYRIELGEIEASLLAYAGVAEVSVIVREDRPGDKRLVAYYTGEQAPLADALRIHVRAALPDYMVPVAFVKLDALPLTANGKVDRRALPAPEGDAYTSREYEAPRGPVEWRIAQIWAELLKVERVGRADNFFELGGHSLLAITVIERMRQAELHADVRALFGSPTLAELAASVGHSSQEFEVPPNRIPAGATRITPDMLPLIDLEQSAIDEIALGVPSGAENVQDIYPLTPLQEGILFHHLMNQQGDVYLEANLLSFADRGRLEKLLQTLQRVIDRHDILRTKLSWRGLPEPVQVVQRHAMLPVEWVTFDASLGDVSEQLKERYSPRRYRIDVGSAPLLQATVTHDPRTGRWLLLLLVHHLAVDHTTVDLLVEEAREIERGREWALPTPAPFRNFVAHTRLGVTRSEHEAFFQRLLGDIEASTAPFGLLDVQGDGAAIREAELQLESGLSARIRRLAKRYGVSAASLMHLAWALVVAMASSRREVVFGTVLFGRMQGGKDADRMLGMLMNTLPLRFDVKDQGALAALREMQALLAELIRHEHAPLSLAQRCSQVAAQTPLFSALFNYRHISHADAGAVSSEHESDSEFDGDELWAEERTNYPLTFSVNDLGEGFSFSAQVQAPVMPERVCEFMATALSSLVEALESAPERRLSELELMPAAETRRVIEDWNQTDRDYPSEASLAELFDAQLQRNPDAVAVIEGVRRLTYAELSGRANQLARALHSRGVKPGDFVAIALERSLELVIAELGISVAGAAYVPLDAVLPGHRQALMLGDCQAKQIVTRRAVALPAEVEQSSAQRLDIDGPTVARQSQEALAAQANGGSPSYLMYTSGSTGLPKGVVVAQRGVTRLVLNNGFAELRATDRVAFASNPAFDASTFEMWSALLNGGAVVVITQEVLFDVVRLAAELKKHAVNVLFLTVGLFNQYATALGKVIPSLRYLITGGDALDARVMARVLRENPPKYLINAYGPTETAVMASTHLIEHVADAARSIPLGRPIGNTRIYVLDERRRPVPVGVKGELYVGGPGVALGYLNRPELTSERFVKDPFVPGGKLYKTGDVGLWLADGTIEFCGRNDSQVKVRGFRIELGEIEARLSALVGIREVTVQVREDEPGNKRLVLYYTGREFTAEELRAHALAGLPEYMVPAAFVKLETLPLTPSGKLDRRALPAPEATAYATRSYQAPQGEIEQKAAEIWGQLLQVERVGRYDNFFELGGHSLLAVQVVSRMQQALKREVPLRTLIACPALHAFAAAIALPEAPRQSSNLVVIRGEGSKAPLFFVHAGGGEVSFVHELAKHLDADQPVYGLAASGFSKNEVALSSLEEIAANYVAAIRTVAPRGPYRLAGYSAGGTIAYAMAKLLLEAGESIGFLGLVDTHADLSGAGVRQLTQAIEGQTGALRDATALRFMFEGSLPKKLAEQVKQASRAGEFAAMITLLRRAKAVPGELDQPALERMVRVFTGLSVAVVAYRPVSLPIAATLFRSSDRKSPDSTLGWGALLGERLNLLETGGEHDRMMESPHVNRLGRALQQALDAKPESEQREAQRPLPPGPPGPKAAPPPAPPAPPAASKIARKRAPGASLGSTRLVAEIAVRNLVANRWKTLIVGGISGIGACLIVVGGAVLDGVDSAMRASIVSSGAGHIQVYSSESKSELSIMGDSDLDQPDIAPIDDFARLRGALSAVPNVEAVVPMGFSDSVASSGNAIDRALDSLRESVTARQREPGSADVLAKYESEKREARQRLSVLGSELEANQQISMAAPDPAQTSALERSLSEAFWTGFDADPLASLDFLEGSVAPLAAPAEPLPLRYVGTDPGKFGKVFERMRIVEGSAIPAGERGFLFSKLVYEQQVKLKAARGLDYIKRARDTRQLKIADDADLQRVVAENGDSVSELMAQLDLSKIAEFREKLQTKLHSTETEVSRLLVAFLTTNDANFDERYAFFYSSLAPRLKLYRIAVGETLTLRTQTRNGYTRSANVKVYGTYDFKGLENSLQAGAVNMLDLVTFRELYGFTTQDSEKEVGAMRAAAGAVDVQREGAEAALFGSKEQPKAATKAASPRADQLAELRGTRAQREQVERMAYDPAQLEQGSVLNAAIVVRDETRIPDTLDAIEAAGISAGLKLRAIPWDQAAGLVGQFVTLLRGVLISAVLITFVVALIVISNALVMATLDRVKEIGAMRAMGAQRRFVLALLLVESMVTGLVAGVAGAGFGGLTLLVLGKVGIPAANDMMTFFFCGPRLFPEFGISNLLFSVLTIVVVGMLAGLYPAWLAMRVSPREAMQSEE